MDILKTFGDNLKHYRNQKNITQEDFAEECGLHRTYISAIECYKRSVSLKNIQKIARALNIEPYLLLKKREGKNG